MWTYRWANRLSYVKFSEDKIEINHIEQWVDLYKYVKGCTLLQIRVVVKDEVNC